MRKVSDIKRIVVDTEYPGVAGWVVTITYTDGKAANWSIDMGENMIQAVAYSIKAQLKSKSHA